MAIRDYHIHACPCGVQFPCWYKHCAETERKECTSCLVREMFEKEDAPPARQPVSRGEKRA